jgi:diguanylate cyclase (GGDEF)-like protein/PAS domain S-box-containing protein
MQSNLADGRVLLVDDDPRLCQSVSELLHLYGCQPEIVWSGEEALEKLQQNHFEVLLLDLHLPGVDGHAVMDFINRQGIDTLVVVISGEAGFDAVSAALKQGAYDYIKKPYAPQELLSTLKNALKKHRLQRDNQRMHQQLVRSEQLHRFVVNHSPDLVFILDQAGHINFLNQRAESLLNYPADAMLGANIVELVDPEDEDRARLFFSRVVHEGEQLSSIELCLKSHGLYARKHYFEITVSTSHNPLEGVPSLESGELLIYGSARDITERKEAADFINFQAYHDLLTRLPNRVLFKDRLSVTIFNAMRNRSRFAVMFLDLDRFKAVNDTLGHTLGDRLLQSVAQRLLESMRSSDTLSRFGGDEFILLFPEVTSTEGVEQMATKIIGALKQPFDIKGHSITIGCSIGIAIFPEAGEDMETLVQNADIAMYNAKDSGRDSYSLFSPAMTDSPAFRLSLEQDIRRAISDDEFCLHYQPQVDIESQRIVGVEALVRWQHPERGLLYPSEFIAVAEEIRLVLEVDKWVLRHACRTVKAWFANGLPQIKLAVNLSALLVEQDDFVEFVLHILEEEEFPAQCLELEITESALLKDREQITRKLERLSNAGVRFALDDFGTGYSSLSYLHQYPIDTLKIDQSFVSTVGDSKCANLVDTIVAMARSLRLDIVAEGVESRPQLHYLSALGCRHIQGWLLGKAYSELEIVKVLDFSLPELEQWAAQAQLELH